MLHLRSKLASEREKLIDHPLESNDSGAKKIPGNKYSFRKERHRDV